MLLKQYTASDPGLIYRNAYWLFGGVTVPTIIVLSNGGVGIHYYGKQTDKVLAKR